jgi:hypothetical protein
MDLSTIRPEAEIIAGVELPPFGRFNILQVCFAQELARRHPLASEVNVPEMAIKSLPLLRLARQHFRDGFPDVLVAIMRLASTDRQLAAYLADLSERELSFVFGMVELAVHQWRDDATAQSGRHFSPSAAS